MINNERLLNAVLNFVRIDSESRHEKAMTRRRIADLTAIGCKIYMDDTVDKTGSDTGSVYAALPGTVPGKPILLCAHMDTVVPGAGVEPVAENGAVRGKGDAVLGADDTSGIAAIAEAVRTAAEQNILRPTIELVFTVREEIGLFGSGYMDHGRLTAKKAAVPDGGGQGAGMTPKLIPTGGGSDTNNMCRHGITALMVSELSKA